MNSEHNFLRMYIYLPAFLIYNVSLLLQMGTVEHFRGKIRTKRIFVKYGSMFYVKFKLHDG